MFQTRSAAASLSATSQHTTSLPASNSVQNIPTTSSSTATPAPAGNQTPQDVQSILADRKARLEAQKKEQEARAAAKRAADSKARNAALNDRPEGSEKSADMKYALMQKKRAQDAKDERARILKRVEDDKIRRKQEAAQQKALAKERQNPGSAGDVAEGGFDAVPPSKYSKECALQVRLFDGSTIRSRFPSEGSLRADVRPWIDKQQTGDVPYNFKHVLTPLPNKNISISDEEGSLHSQGLTPSATLILGMSRLLTYRNTVCYCVSQANYRSFSPHPRLHIRLLPLRHQPSNPEHLHRLRRRLLRRWPRDGRPRKSFRNCHAYSCINPTAL